VQIVFQKHPTEGCIPACVLSVLTHRLLPHKHTEESLIGAIKIGGIGTDFVRLQAGAPELRLSVGRIPTGVGGADNFFRSREAPGTMVCLKHPANHCVVIVAFQPNDADPPKGVVVYLDPNPALRGTPRSILLADFVERHTGEWARLPENEP
jgi:hypothetical protein